jgi:uncharacterized protein
VSGSDVVRAHVAAFNARDLDALLDCFHGDATWVTGTTRVAGRDGLEQLFGDAFAALAPRLTVHRLLAVDDVVACELEEEYVVGDETRVDHIAGFYRVADGRIVAAKIYREGSADAV